jgi:SAM-dependent methyltransferase/uncharacterized protein YbaR (Trm112 family)
MNPLLLSLLACPVTGLPLRQQGDELVSEAGASYPVIDGIPLLFHPEATDSIGAMACSRLMNGDSVGMADDPFFLNTLDVSASHRTSLATAVPQSLGPVDPVVSQMIAATNGNLYRGLVGKLPRYPIPEFRLKQGAGRLLLDIGCNWGRWCLAAAKEGYIPVGIDPQFGAVAAAQRVARQLGVEAYFVCGDARHLPFRRDAFDAVFSYSVLQHLSRSDVRAVAASAAAVMKAGAEFMIQMPTRCGVRNLIQQARRGFADGAGFDVRYWSRCELRAVFEPAFGPLAFEVDCFFGIGLQPADADLLPPAYRLLIQLSDALRRLPLLTPFADSLYLHGNKPTSHLN